MALSQQTEFLTEAEYWIQEELSPTRNEYFSGRVYAMELSSYNHTTICGNILATGKNALRGSSFKYLSGGMRVKVEATGLITYPDGIIFDSSACFEGVESHTLLTPKVIFEVFSDSTESYDRGIKFHHYRKIESLTDYVLIDQSQVWVDHFQKVKGGWLLNSFTRRTEILRLAEPTINFPMELIYEDLQIPDFTFSIPPRFNLELD